MSRRLRECANGPDLEGYLRGFDQGKLWQGAGWLRLRQSSEAGAAEWPSVLRTHRRADHAEGNHMTRDRTLEAPEPGSAGTMRNWRYIVLHALTAAAFIF